VSDELLKPPVNKPLHQEIRELNKAINAGSQQAFDQLQRLLDQNPGIWQTIGDVAQVAEQNLLTAITVENRTYAEAIKRKMAELREQLLGETPSALEKLAVQRVVACFLEVQFIDMKYPGDAGKSLPMARFAQQCKLAAQRRFDSAMKGLLLVRKMQPEIEIANQELQKRKKKIIQLPERASA